MELMSSLLLCALATLLPQALGVKSSFLSEIKRESPKVIEMPLFHKTLWIRRKTPSEVTIDMLFKYLYGSDKCSMCTECLKKALYFSTAKKTEASPKHVLSRDFIFNDIIENYHQDKVIRNRRDTGDKISPNTKRSRVSKSKNVTVTKYNIDGQVYAIKLRENNSTHTYNQQGERTCQVFSIKKYYPCGSPKAELIFTNARRKANKRNKKQAKNTLTTSKPQSQSLASRDKSIAEPFMTSIEELYN